MRISTCDPSIAWTLFPGCALVTLPHPPRIVSRHRPQNSQTRQLFLLHTLVAAVFWLCKLNRWKGGRENVTSAYMYLPGSFTGLKSFWPIAAGRLSCVCQVLGKIVIGTYANNAVSLNAFAPLLHFVPLHFCAVNVWCFGRKVHSQALYFPYLVVDKFVCAMQAGCKQWAKYAIFKTSSSVLVNKSE